MDSVLASVRAANGVVSPSCPVFVVEGHDIELYPDPASAAAHVEGYDAPTLDFIGADGTVYEAVVEGPEWGPVALRDSGRNDLTELVALLRTVATFRSVALPADLPDERTAIWEIILEHQHARRTPRRRWWKPDR